MAEAVVILNPAARNARALRVHQTIAKLPGCKLVYTAAAGDGRILARKAVEEGYRTIVAAGGDGTINDIVNGMADSDAVLGVLPVGTMNVFAAELGIPSNLQKAWEIIQGGHTRRIDLASANGKYFVQLAGVGFDAQIVESTTWAAKQSYGPLSYLFSAAQIASRTPPLLCVETNEGRHEGSLVLLGNGRFYGGPLAFFKNAVIDDGKLDVLVFKNLGYLDLARYLGCLLMGRHTELSDVEYFQTDRMTVTSASRVPFEADGELLGHIPVTFGVAPRALQVLVPGPLL